MAKGLSYCGHNHITFRGGYGLHDATEVIFIPVIWLMQFIYLNVTNQWHQLVMVNGFNIDREEMGERKQEENKKKLIANR